MKRSIHPLSDNPYKLKLPTINLEEQPENNP